MTPSEQRAPGGYAELRRALSLQGIQLPATAALGLIGVPECYSEPEAVYGLAKVRHGHRCAHRPRHDRWCDGTGRARFENVIVGEDVTVHFPEDRCKFHVLVWGISPEEHEQISRHKLRDDVYDFARLAPQENLAHALAHPLTSRTASSMLAPGSLCPALQGIRDAERGRQRHAPPGHRPLPAWFKPGNVHVLIECTGLEPVWPSIWEKAKTGGSDDHALLNVGHLDRSAAGL